MYSWNLFIWISESTLYFQADFLSDFMWGSRIGKVRRDVDGRKRNVAFIAE